MGSILDVFSCGVHCRGNLLTGYMETHNQLIDKYNKWCSIQQQGKTLPDFEAWKKLYKTLTN